MSLTISTNSNASYAGFNSSRNSMSLQQSLSRLLGGRRNPSVSNDSVGLTVMFRHEKATNRLKSGGGKTRDGNFFMESPHALRSQANTSSSAVLMLTQ